MIVRRLTSFFVFVLIVSSFLSVPSSVRAEEIKGLKATASSWKEWGAPNLLVDSDITTAWVAGRTGVGPGKSITIQLSKAQKIGMIRIANGNQGEGLLNNFRSVTNGVLVLADSAVHFFSIKPEAGEQDIIFPSVTVDSFDIIIAEVQPAADDTKLGDAKVAISEVRVFSEASADAKETVSSISSMPPSKNISKKSRGKSKMGFFSATKPGYVYLMASVPARDEALSDGVLHKAVGQDFLNLISTYFEKLVTMNDDYLDVFDSSIRIRELEAYVGLQDEMRSKGQYDSLRSAEVFTNGLNVNKPIIRGDAAMARTHGVCRYTMNGKSFEFPVDALFSFVRNNGTWLINGVQNKL